MIRTLARTVISTSCIDGSSYPECVGQCIHVLHNTRQSGFEYILQSENRTGRRKNIVFVFLCYSINYLFGNLDICMVLYFIYLFISINWLKCKTKGQHEKRKTLVGTKCRHPQRQEPLLVKTIHRAAQDEFNCRFKRAGCIFLGGSTRFPFFARF